MLRKIVFILALLCALAVSNTAMGAVNWQTTVVWHNTDGDQNWFNPNDWVHNGGQPDGAIPPDGDTWTIIEPYPVIIDGDAACSGLGVCYWSWAGAPDIVVEVNTGTLNAGEIIGLSTGDNFAYTLLDPNGLPLNAPGSAGLTVRGGTVTTPLASGAGTGLIIGGGGSSYSISNIGRVVMYGGLISVPRIALQHGDIALYGGTLECTGTIDANFVFYQNRPRNKIDISGGTLKFAGDATAALNALKTSGRIYSARGTIGTPVFSAGATTLTSTDNNMVQPWNPSPANSATNVHYKYATDPCYITLSWVAGDVNVINTAVYFGTNANLVNSVYGDSNYMGEVNEANVAVLPDGEPNTFNINFNFTLNTNYYWRVDSNSIVSYTYDEFGTITGAITSVVKGDVWTFKTHDGMAYNPKPTVGATSLSEPLQLSWTAGDFAASTNGHKVYFATGSNLLNATLRKTWTTADSRYRGLQSGTSYSLARLAGSFALTPGTTYYWCVDEVSGASLWQGPVWSFTTADYVTVDDFEDYNTSAEVQANWDTAYDSTCYYPVGNGSVALVQDAAGKHMRYHYSNLSGQETSFTEIRRSYNPGTSFTGSGALVPAPAALRVDYIGSTGNGVDPDYDRMYVALQDTAGNIGIVMNDDANAARVVTWTSWFVSLRDFNTAPNPTALKLTDVNAFMLGFGIRCDYGTVGGDGNMIFDNIRLYAQTCNPTFAHTTGGLTADLDNDCDVDINDLDRFADHWLWVAVPEHTISGITAPHKAPVIHYPFNESDGTKAVNSAAPGTDTDANVLQDSGNVLWDPTGGRNGDACITFNTLPSQNTRAEVPVAAFDFLTDEAHYNNTGNGGSVSFSMWVNTDFSVGDTMSNNWATVFSAWDAAQWGFEGVCYLSLPASFGSPSATFVQHPTAGTSVGVYGPQMTPSFFGGKWNHWAAVKSEPNVLIVYCNGSELARTTNADVAAAPLIKLPIQSFRIGMRGSEWSNWGKWSGKMQDFKVWDYALDANEVAYEATDGTGVVELIPLVSTANIVTTGAAADQVVNFADVAKMCDQWRTQILWP